MKSLFYFNPNVNKNISNRLSYILFNGTIDYKSIIHSGRNTIWTINMNNVELAIKMFDNGIKSKLFYTFMPSKAKKSMRNAIQLLKLGISTPMPIAYAEIRNPFLQKCWYVSEFEQSISYDEALSKHGDKVIDSFAEFVAIIHEKGILHNDLNSTNVRVRISPNGTFQFSLIDLNRMHIYPKGKVISRAKWMKDVCRFCHIDKEFKYFSLQYLNKRNLPNALIEEMLKIKRKHDNKNKFKNKIKKYIRL